MDQMNPAFLGGQGMLGSGMAQKAGQTLNWRAAYQKYAIDMAEMGQRALPMAKFVEEASRAMQAQAGSGKVGLLGQ